MAVIARRRTREIMFMGCLRGGRKPQESPSRRTTGAPCSRRIDEAEGGDGDCSAGKRRDRRDKRCTVSDGFVRLPCLDASQRHRRHEPTPNRPLVIISSPNTAQSIPSPSTPERVTFYHWVVIAIASAGWLFDCMD